MKIMFVCTGNTCRSPMAEAIFRDIAPDAEVCSAGISASSGQRASEEAVEVCAENGIDLSGHFSTNVRNSRIREMDLVLTAQVSHKEDLQGMYPDLKIRTIKECAEGYDDLDIDDPIGGSKERYEDCFFEMKEALEKISSKCDFKKEQ